MPIGLSIRMMGVIVPHSRTMIDASRKQLTGAVARRVLELPERTGYRARVERKVRPMQPTYFVKHPDDTYSPAKPQPTLKPATRGKDLGFLKDTILIDAEGNRSRIINVRGHEAGLDHLEITTQSPWEKSEGLKTVHRIYSEETSA